MMSVNTSATSFDPSFAESKGRSLWRFLAPFAVGLALLSAFLTFVVLTGLTPIAPTSQVVLCFILINAAIILVLVGIIGREVWQVLQARRRGRAAARLHVQIVSLFSVIAVLPAVLVAIVANVTIDRGLDRLFSGPTREAIQNSLTIARAYTLEHAELIRGDILGMANDIAHARPLYDQDRETFRQLLTASAVARNLPAAMLIDKDRNVLEKAETGVQLNFPPPPPDILSHVKETEPEISVFPENYVAAVIRLRAFNDTFLYVARLLDPHVVAQLNKTQASVAEYAEIESRRLAMQVSFALMFAVIALTILMASVLIGLNFANGLVAPIRRLMSAANVVSTGDLHVQVPVQRSGGDLAQLGETFNKMTQELRTQRDELVNASDLIDSRRRFIEAVLSSASAGIIGVDASGSVGILNRSAEKLIGQAESETLDHPLSEVLPELDDMMKTAREGTQRLVQGQITINRAGHERNLSVRVSAEQTSQSRDSYIITLDDITELVSAQRTSAWGDVARRIAHEIRESADADPAFGRAHPPQIRQGHHRRQGDLRAMHRYHRAPGRRYPADGRRILAFRPDAEARDGGRGCRRYRPPGRVPDARRTSRNRYRGRDQAGSDARAVRPEADFAGPHQHHQECDRGDRGGSRRGTGEGPYRRHCGA